MSSFDPFGLQSLTTTLNRIERKVNTMALDLTGLKAAVAAESLSVDHALALLTEQSASLADIKTQLAAAIAANDPAELQGVVDSITAEQGKVDAAITALTPTP